MSTKNVASIWASHNPNADGTSPDSYFKCLINNICGQHGYRPGISSESSNYWKASRRGNPRQTQYLAWNSQLAPTFYPDSNPYWWQNYGNNPIPGDHPRVAEWTIPGTNLMNCSDPDYCLEWAKCAVKKAQAWERISKNYWSGIFADSICWGWWWGGDIPACYGTLDAYHKAQEQFCSIVGDYVKRRQYKFGANVGVAGPTLAIWPEVLTNLNLVFKEHVRAEHQVDSVILDLTRKYVLAIHIEANPSLSESVSQQLSELAIRYKGLLTSKDYVTYGGMDSDLVIRSL